MRQVCTVNISNLDTDCQTLLLYVLQVKIKCQNEYGSSEYSPPHLFRTSGEASTRLFVELVQHQFFSFAATPQRKKNPVTKHNSKNVHVNLFYITMIISGSDQIIRIHIRIVIPYTQYCFLLFLPKLANYECI